MKIRAVADVLEHVFLIGEGRHAHPRCAFAAHLGVARGVAIHRLRQEVAADAGQCLGAFRNFRAGAMWAAGAEVGHARHTDFRFLVMTEQMIDGGDAVHQAVVGHVAQNPMADHLRDLIRIERAGRQEHRLSSLVVLADNARRIRLAVQHFLDLTFHQAALFFNKDNEIQTLGELLQALGFHRPCHADLIQPHTQARAIGIAQIQFV